MNDLADRPEIQLDHEALAHDAWAQGVLRRQSAMLEQLAEAALRMALAVERRVSEPEPDQPLDAAAAAMAFSRVAKAVRLTAMLQSRLVQDLERLRRGAAPRAAEAEDIARRLEPLYRHKARVEAVVERVAKADTDDEDRIDRLVCEAGERLDDEDLYGELLDRPVGELVSLICRDLGLEPDWTRLAEEAWAKAEMDDPRSPFFNAASPACGRGGPRSGGEGMVSHCPMPSLSPFGDISPASGRDRDSS
jgi:hypothetical protein